MGRTRRVTLREAAEILGISKDAARKRINRGTIRSDVGEDGRRYVYLDDGEDAAESPQNFAEGPDHRDALISALRDEVAAWREESRHKNAILAQLARANEEQARTIRVLEAPQEPQNEPESAEPRPDRGTTVPDEPEKPAESRSWWRRMIGR